MAVVDDLITMSLTSGSSSPDALAFAAILQDPEEPEERALKQVCYYIKEDYSQTDSGAPYARNVLMRGMKNKGSGGTYLECFSDPTWSATASDKGEQGNSPFGNTPMMLLDNVTTFEVWVYRLDTGADQPSYRSVDHGLPAYVEILIEVLSEDDARKAALGAAGTDFARKRAMRYFRRVYLNNLPTAQLGEYE